MRRLKPWGPWPWKKGRKRAGLWPLERDIRLSFVIESCPGLGCEATQGAGEPTEPARRPAEPEAR